MERTFYRYPVRLSSVRDMREFVRIASKVPEDVELVSGHHRLSAKSFLSVAFAVVSWTDIAVEAPYDCWFDFESFIV